MKLKLFIVALSVLAVGFLSASSAYAFTTWNFDSYANGSYIENDSTDWTYNYGDHLKVSTSQYSSSPNSLTHSDGDGSLNYTYTHGTTFQKFQLDYKQLSTNIRSWTITFRDTTPNNLFQLFFAYSSNTISICNYGNSNCTACGNYGYGAWTTVYVETTATQSRCKLDLGAWSTWRNNQNSGLPKSFIIDHNSGVSSSYFDNMIFGELLNPFAITSPTDSEGVADDTWMTISGTCPTNGADRIGFTDDCLGFDSIVYNVDCVNNTFSGSFYHRHDRDQIIARDISSQSGDCVDYDAFMDQVEVYGVEIIEGYPDDWYFDFDYYNDYDIKINYPSFDMPSLLLPAGSTEALFSFAFTYPTSSLANMNFNIKEYKSDGTLINGAYDNKNLSAMANTQDYQVSLTASSTEDLHYVVQLTESGEMKRQYPFMVSVSDLDFGTNATSTDYFFPRLVAELKKKAIFNYYFTFHDGFYNMFNSASTVAGATALDLTFNSMSGNLQYDLPIKILSFSDSRVVNFANAIRPYITAVLWILFALYVFFRFSRLFNGGDE